MFAQGAKAEEARAAGADIVGMDDLAAEIKGGKMDFDVVIASPDTMRVVGTLGQILGPRGLMPNPKVGTVTPDVAQAVRNAKAGQVQFRVDKAGIVHATIGRRSFESDKLVANLRALIEALNKSKPASSKGIYLRKVALSSIDGRRRPRRHRVDQRRSRRGGLIEVDRRRKERAAEEMVGRAGRATGRLGSSKTAGAALRELLNGQRRWRSRRRGIEVPVRKVAEPMRPA